MKTRDELIELGVEGFKADEIMLLQEKMLEHAIKFQYTKKDGSVREAFGTLKKELMVQEDGTVWEPKGETKPEAPIWFKYFDLTSQAWRQFNVFNLLAVEG